MDIDFKWTISLGRVYIALGALSAAKSVALGAAAQHGLKPYLAANDIGGWFGVALQYHQLHSVALILCGIALLVVGENRLLKWSGVAFLVGLLMFSGNLYLRSLFDIHLFHAVTPVGGMSFMTGWVLLAVGVLRSNLKEKS